MNSPPPCQQLAVLPGSPAATFREWIAAELAEGTIPYGCPHRVAADRLLLPARTLRCAGCHERDRPSNAPGPCASCEVPGASSWTWWVDERARVLVIAQVCESCGTDGTVPLCPN
jgi:hypothetical protein